MRSSKSCGRAHREDVSVEDLKKFLNEDSNDHCGYGLGNGYGFCDGNGFCGDLFDLHSGIFDDGDGYGYGDGSGDGSGHNYDNDNFNSYNYKFEGA